MRIGGGAATIRQYLQAGLIDELHLAMPFLDLGDRGADPEIDLDVVAGSPRPGNYQYAINNSFGFGGHNVALAFGKY